MLTTNKKLRKGKEFQGKIIVAVYEMLPCIFDVIFHDGSRRKIILVK